MGYTSKGYKKPFDVNSKYLQNIVGPPKFCLLTALSLKILQPKQEKLL